MRCRSIAARNCARSKRGIVTMRRAAPQGVVEHDRLAVDVEERQHRDHAVVLADRRARGSYWQRFATRLRCVSITPLGSPVVPLENGSATRCVRRVDRRAAARASRAPRAARRTASRPRASPIAKTSSTPAAAAASSARSASCGTVTRKRAPRGAQLERRLLGRVERVDGRVRRRRRARRRGTRPRTRARWARRSRRARPGSQPARGEPRSTAIDVLGELRVRQHGAADRIHDRRPRRPAPPRRRARSR